LQGIVEKLSALGATLLAISPELPAHNLSVIESNKLSFDIVSDPENAYTAKLGLRFSLPPEIKKIYQGFGLDLPVFNGDPGWTLPMPARLVVDRFGIVRATDVDPDYTVRPEPQKTLDDVAALK
jgi:peroxiredoxin